MSVDVVVAVVVGGMLAVGGSPSSLVELVHAVAAIATTTANTPIVRCPAMVPNLGASVAWVKVAHIILRVKDLDESIAFYRDVVGLDLVSQSSAFAFFDGGSISIALNANPDQKRDNSLTEIALEVDDVAAAYDEMAGRGVGFEIELRPVMEQDGRSLLAAHFFDPDGHTWSVTGWA